MKLKEVCATVSLSLLAAESAQTRRVPRDDALHSSVPAGGSQDRQHLCLCKDLLGVLDDVPGS